MVCHILFAFVKPPACPAQDAKPKVRIFLVGQIQPSHSGCKPCQTTDGHVYECQTQQIGACLAWTGCNGRWLKNCRYADISAILFYVLCPAAHTELVSMQ